MPVHLRWIFTAFKNNIFDNLTGPVEGSATIFLNNLVSNSSGFIDRAGYNFHLSAQSPARNKAGNPGTYSGVDLRPVKEYVHPTQSQQRFDDGKLDIGAFEFVTSAPQPGGESSIVPANFLLLK